jgi:hypothetical protein
MDVGAVLEDLYGRLPDLVRGAVEGLTPDQLATSPQPGANSIAWLVWHIGRVQDTQIAEHVPQEQRYLTGGWHGRFGRGADPGDSGYGHTAAEMASVRGTAEDLLGYNDEVHAMSRGFVRQQSGTDLERIIDTSYDPPVTLGVRLVSIAEDCLQHAGQAAYVRGLLTA